MELKHLRLLSGTAAFEINAAIVLCSAVSLAFNCLWASWLNKLGAHIAYLQQVANQGNAREQHTLLWLLWGLQQLRILWVECLAATNLLCDPLRAL